MRAKPKATMIRHPACWCAVCFIVSCAGALAGESATQNDVSDFFQPGRYEVRLSSAVMFSPVGADHNRPIVNYVLNGLEAGRMMSGAHGEGWLRGSWQMSLEAIGAAVFQG